MAFVLLGLVLSGCTTTCTSSSKKQEAQANPFGSTVPGRRLVLLNPDGSRTEIPNYVNPPSAAFVAPPYEWAPERAPKGPLTIEVVLGEQKLYVFRNGVEIGFCQISTGKEGLNTPAGKYEILQKKKDYHSNLYGALVDTSTGKIVNSNASAGTPRPPGTRYEPSPMPFFQRLSWEGVGLHEGYLPGYPASHGCIRMHPDFAPKLFEITKVGDKVTIVETRRTPRALPGQRVSYGQGSANPPSSYAPAATVVR
jgi:hypothetical protein